MASIPLQYPLDFEQLKVSELPKLVDVTLEELDQGLLALASLHGRDLLYALDKVNAPSEHLRKLIDQLAQLCGGKWAEARESQLPRLEEALEAIWRDPELLVALQSINPQELTTEEQRWLTLSLEQFRRNGTGLSAAQQQELSELNARLRALTSQYAQNVQRSIDAFVLDVQAADLDGLPPHVLEATRQVADHHRLTLHFPVYGPVMAHATSREVREKMWRAWQAVGTEGECDNRPLILGILRLRRQKAQLLGYKSFAEYAMAPTMAAHPEVVEEFLSRLETATRPGFEQEKMELEAFYHSQAGAAAPPLAPWDMFFWTQRLREHRYSYDSSTLRPYFTLKGVLEGLFELCHRLFDVSFVKVAVPVWHPEVEAYELRDQSGKLVGAFYADWHPRPGKRNSGWVSPVLKGDDVHVAFLCTTLPRPTATQPALLSLYEAKILVHEFGHVLHHLLSHAPLRHLSGMDVPMDFVEVPSQLLENWLAQPEGLAFLSRHHETGEPLPPELLNVVTQAGSFQKATETMRDLSFARVDLALHQLDELQNEQEPVEAARTILARFQPVPLEASMLFITNFNHYFSRPDGYASLYYSYKWAETKQAELFHRFEIEGVMNPATGQLLKQKVLSQGNRKDPQELIEEFLRS